MTPEEAADIMDEGLFAESARYRLLRSRFGFRTQEYFNKWLLDMADLFISFQDAFVLCQREEEESQENLQRTVNLMNHQGQAHDDMSLLDFETPEKHASVPSNSSTGSSTSPATTSDFSKPIADQDKMLEKLKNPETSQQEISSIQNVDLGSRNDENIPLANNDDNLSLQDLTDSNGMVIPNSNSIEEENLLIDMNESSDDASRPSPFSKNCEGTSGLDMIYVKPELTGNDFPGEVEDGYALPVTEMNIAEYTRPQMKPEIAKKPTKKYRPRLSVNLPPGGYYSQSSDKKEQLKSNSKFCCRECGAFFSSNYELVCHRSTHTGNWPRCNICHQVFRSKYSLKTHARIHTGEQPFVCRICNKAFNVRSNMYKHQRMHHPDSANFFCRICAKKVTNVTLMKKHYMDAHHLLSETNRSGDVVVVGKVADAQNM